MLSLKKRLVLLLCCSAAASAYAQNTQKHLSINELVNHVINHAPTLIADSSEILLSQAIADETANNWLPNLRLNYQADVGTNNNVAGPYFGFGIIPSNSRGVRESNNNNTALTNTGIAAMDWELYNFGSYKAQNKVAQSEIQIKKKEFEFSKFQLQGASINGFLQLLLYQERMRIQSATIERNRDIERSILALARSGIRAGVDTSIAQAELSKSKLNYIELNNEFKQIQLRLSYLSGLPPASIVPDTGLQEKLLNKGIAILTQAADTIGHPLLGIYESIYQNSLEKETAVKKAYNPKISLQAAAWGRGSSITSSDEFRSLSEGWGFDRNNYLVGLGISYNFSDLKRRQLKLRTQKAATIYEFNKLNTEKQELALKTKQSQTELLTALDKLREIPNQLKAAQAGYRQKLSLYKNGLTDIIELNVALSLLYRAETDYAIAKNNFCLALLQRSATGNQLNDLLNLLK